MGIISWVFFLVFCGCFHPDLFPRVMTPRHFFPSSRCIFYESMYKPDSLDLRLLFPPSKIQISRVRTSCCFPQPKEKKKCNENATRLTVTTAQASCHQTTLVFTLARTHAICHKSTPKDNLQIDKFVFLSLICGEFECPAL